MQAKVPRLNTNESSKNQARVKLWKINASSPEEHYFKRVVIDLPNSRVLKRDCLLARKKIKTGAFQTS